MCEKCNRLVSAISKVATEIERDHDSQFIEKTVATILHRILSNMENGK